MLVESIPPQTHPDPAVAGFGSFEPAPAARIGAICFGAAVTICVYGYQFGQSNHTVYLLDALHRANPSLLANDWFTTQTFQYHAAFGWLTRGLMRVGLLETGFLAGYLALVFLFHVAWMGLVLRLGGSVFTYLVSVLLYYLSAGGTGLGMYQFFQDSSFLPSNLANVAMLWGLYWWIARRPIRSGAALGTAGAFHLNHAIVAVGLWAALVGWMLRRDPSDAWEARELRGARGAREAREARGARGSRSRALWIGSALALVPCLLNIAFAAVLELDQAKPSLPLHEFIDLYVRFRHPHHYDPRAWPAALWVSFLWPIPAAAIAARRLIRPSTSVQDAKADSEIHFAACQAVRIFLVLSALIIVALIGAGAWYVSGTLVQMSLYRFSIYLQLLACTGAAMVLCSRHARGPGVIGWLLAGAGMAIGVTPLVLSIAERGGWTAPAVVEHFVREKSPALWLFAVLCAVPVLWSAIERLRGARRRRAARLVLTAACVGAIIVGWNRWTGLTQILEKPDPAYLRLCDWVRHNTPADAIFVVPPQQMEFRYEARRAIVVNFKGVPQLAGEIGQWRDRLLDVLGLPDFSTLPRGFDRTRDAMGQMYRQRSIHQLSAVASKYGARYVIATHPRDPRDPGDPRDPRDKPRDHPRLILDVDGRYLLYDLKR